MIHPVWRTNQQSYFSQIPCIFRWIASHDCLKGGLERTAGESKGLISLFGVFGVWYCRSDCVCLLLLRVSFLHWTLSYQYKVFHLTWVSGDVGLSGVLRRASCAWTGQAMHGNSPAYYCPSPETVPQELFQCDLYDIRFTCPLSQLSDHCGCVSFYFALLISLHCWQHWTGAREHVWSCSSVDFVY